MVPVGEYSPGTMWAQVKVRISSSKRGFSLVVASQAEVAMQV